MNEYLLVFVATLLFFNLPKILGHLIRGIGLKKIELTFAENNEIKSKEISLIKNKTVAVIQDKPKRNYLPRKKIRKLK